MPDAVRRVLDALAAMPESRLRAYAALVCLGLLALLLVGAQVWILVVGTQRPVTPIGLALYPFLCAIPLLAGDTPRAVVAVIVYAGGIAAIWMFTAWGWCLPRVRVLEELDPAALSGRARRKLDRLTRALAAHDFEPAGDLREQVHPTRAGQRRDVVRFFRHRSAPCWFEAWCGGPSVQVRRLIGSRDSAGRWWLTADHVPLALRFDLPEVDWLGYATGARLSSMLAGHFRRAAGVPGARIDPHAISDELHRAVLDHGVASGELREEACGYDVPARAAWTILRRTYRA